MRYRNLFGKTLRKRPQDVKSDGLAHLLRAGYIRPLGHGLYSYLPLGMRTLGRLRGIIREEIESVGGQEVSVPLVNPLEIWQRSGRDHLVDEAMVRFADRNGRHCVLSPSHEEAFVELVRHGIRSYRDFPALLYQFQRKYRDEERVRHGLLRLKEFEMKDAYSFHRSSSDLNNFFPKIFAAYERVFQRCGLDVISAESGVGYMGGEKAYEFLMECSIGDDFVAYCPSCGYRANRRLGKAGKHYEKGIPKALKEVQTPGVKTIEELSSFFDLPRSAFMKSIVYRSPNSLVMAVVRGDYEISEDKLSSYIGKPVIGFAGEEELREIGLVPGFISPLGAEGRLEIVVDESVAGSVNLICGGGEPDLHMKHCNFGRDFESPFVTDIVMAKEGDRCLQCGGKIGYKRAIELGNIFKLGDFYSRSMGLSFREENGRTLFPHMGSYGIGLDRLLGAMAESLSDGRGLVWPVSVAPYRFFLMGIGKSESVRKEVEALYRGGEEDILLDDRRESPGVKFKDSELMGIPYRIVISSSTLQDGMAELFDRRRMEKRRVPLADLRGVMGRLREDV